MNRSLLSPLSRLAALGLAACSLGAHAQVGNGDFAAGLSGWNPQGDVVATAGTMTLTTAWFDDQGLDPDTAFNLSGSPALGIAEVETALGLAAYALDLGDDAQATEGSAAGQSFAVAAGDTLSFSWRLDSSDDAAPDHAVVVLDGLVFTLATADAAPAGWQSFSHQFTLAGTAQLGFGVVDIADVGGVSSLSISNVQLTAAIPEPGTWALLALGLGAVAWRTRRRA